MSDIPAEVGGVDRFTDADRAAVLAAVTDAANRFVADHGAGPIAADRVTEFVTVTGPNAGIAALGPGREDVRDSELVWIDKAVRTALAGLGVPLPPPPRTGNNKSTGTVD